MSTLKQRLARVVPYFRDNSRSALLLAAVGNVVAAATEPVLPWILKVILDHGFQQAAGRLIPT